MKGEGVKRKRVVHGSDNRETGIINDFSTGLKIYTPSRCFSEHLGGAYF